MENGQPVEGSLYIYAPNKGAPIFFTIAFAASAVGHIWQCYHYKCFNLMWLHPLCAVLFTAGYALREYEAFNYFYNTQNLIIYILSQVLIYLCSLLLELANYHILGRLFYYVPPFALPPDRVQYAIHALVAVAGFTFFGITISSNLSSSQSGQKMGKGMAIAALMIQLCLIGIFVLLAATFHRRCAKANIHAKAVSTILITLYISMSLILIRCIDRLVEHLANTTVRLNDLESLKNLSPILRYEWFFYVFEATLMLLNSVLWNVWNPGRYLPRDHRVHLAEDGRTEVEDPRQTHTRESGLDIFYLLPLYI